MTQVPGETYFDDFEQRLAATGRDALHMGEIGNGIEIPGPFGPQRLLYADYVASGRSLRQVEEAVMTDILPWYANSHTEASHCGATMTRLRRAARDYIARQIGAGPDHAVIFAGSGATAGLNRLVHLFGIADALTQGRDVQVFVGPYEHHSNILPWRESGAQVIEIAEGTAGGPCPDALARALDRAPAGALLIGTFSAASNVTGKLTDIAAITKLLKAHGALSVWDYAGGGPYMPIRMDADGAGIDAIAVSPHKFLGGPGASGLLVIRKDACRATTPTFPGGGTVSFVSPWGHSYSSNIAAREEAGTPNVVGDLRAALAFAVKAAMGESWLFDRQIDLSARALKVLEAAPGIDLLPAGPGARLPILSFRVTQPDGTPVHQQLATRLLSDCFGVQARGGCACAGPYVHRLLDIDEPASHALEARLKAGEELAKPGFVRLSISALLTEDEITRLLDAITQLPEAAARHAAHYQGCPGTAIFRFAA
ncbi:aminotransferase class V-fold PLP-dependent enzyme [Chachezhania sediminis]|uniref:aminotransferase class V-fold PLP-dependent enzyme n=1 Tax=Chachezhania sediminis TaxID=2599291 RepID=UPI00131E2C83|nr:aminotransferase class V-fold PLP-dependent enzyme [Chachezhania sediminis]